MSFRIKNFQIEDFDFEIDEIKLVNENNDLNSNHFTVIVGNNGTGKSRLLGSIVRALRNDFKSRHSKYFYFSKFELEGHLSNIISVSNSINDKFPTDNSYRNNEEYASLNYIYLGNKTSMFTAKKPIRRAIDILLENYSNKFVAKCYRHIFDYLDFQPIIKLEYRFSQLINLKKEYVTVDDLIDYVNQKTTYGGVNRMIYNNFNDMYLHRYPEICDFINTLKDRKYFHLDINFSNNNINKIDENNTIYEDDFKTYEIINILRRLNLVRSLEIKLFKKDSNSPFNINDASSGEASILVTLIGLIPLIKNNSCILIDEPEISLHPSWQYRYIELLSKIFENFKGCHIIVATHSHFIISDLPLEASTIVALKKDNGKISSKILQYNTFGWSAEDILLNVFEMPTTRNYYISNLVSEALEIISKKGIDSKRFKNIKGTLSKLKDQFKEIDPLKVVVETIINL